MPFRSIPLVPCLVVAGAAVFVQFRGHGPAVSARAAALKIVVSETYLPGVDTGLRQGEWESPGAVAAPENGSDDRPYISGSIVAKFRPAASTAAVRAAMAAIAARSSERPDYADFDILHVDPDADPAEVARELAARPEVEYAQPRYKVFPAHVTNDPLYPHQWNFHVLGMERAWDINRGASSSITVAVLDTGVAFREGVIRYFARSVSGFIGTTSGAREFSVPALGFVDVPFSVAPDLAGEGRIVAPRDFIWEDDNPVDIDGHGTHVAGTIGQLTDNGVGVAGMAWNVRIMPVKVLRTQWDIIFGAPLAATDDVLARGMRYAVDNGARVLNMSVVTFTGMANRVILDALRYAVDRGAFIAIAAGNEFDRGNILSTIAELGSRIDGVVVVGAVRPDLTRAGYSTVAPYVELAAPGGDARVVGAESRVFQQTFDLGLSLREPFLLPPARYGPPRFDTFAYAGFTGTSMATPHVAGLAALLISQGITNPAAIEAAMKRYAIDRGEPGRDDEYGYGVINPVATLRGLGLAK